MYRITDLHFMVKFINQIYSEIIKKKHEGPTNKFKRVHKSFFGFFLYSKSSVWLDIKTKRDEIKGVEHKGVFCQTHP